MGKKAGIRKIVVNREIIVIYHYSGHVEVRSNTAENMQLIWKLCETWTQRTIDGKLTLLNPAENGCN